MTAPEAWNFGRRGVLLHLSGFPCQYRRRVAATKLTTSKPQTFFVKFASQVKFLQSEVALQ